MRTFSEGFSGIIGEIIPCSVHSVQSLFSEVERLPCCVDEKAVIVDQYVY